MIFPITIIGNPILRKVSEDISPEYPQLPEFIENMFETMYNSDGVGLACPQTGNSIRLFVMDGNALAEDHPDQGLENFKKVFINAHILEYFGEEQSFNEGCISIPGIREDVVRREKIRIQYQDSDFNLFEEVFEGVKARIIQHEYDHLEGILFTDRLIPLRRKLIKPKLIAVSKGRFSANYKTVCHWKK